MDTVGADHQIRCIAMTIGKLGRDLITPVLHRRELVAIPNDIVREASSEGFYQFGAVYHADDRLMPQRLLQSRRRKQRGNHVTVRAAELGLAQWFDSFADGRTHSDRIECAQGVRPQTDSGTNFGELRRSLIHDHRRAGAPQGDRCAQPGDPGTDDDNFH